MKTIQTEGAPFSLTAAEFIHLGNLIQTLHDQAEHIKRLTEQQNEWLLGKSSSIRRRAEVFRLPNRRD